MEANRCKRILTIQDISCVGRCSLTVALPVLSACGFETAILPTAVLSTHTGGFGTPAVVHLDSRLEEIIAHWKSRDIFFDVILVGYLGSIGAVNAAQTVISELKSRDGIAIVDPAMGDRGRLYSGITGEYAREMKGLCAMADVLVPNITEAAWLTGMSYREKLDPEYVKSLLERLENECTVITGISYEEGKNGVVFHNGAQQGAYFHRQLEGHYHGTGDLFAAALTGALMRFGALEEAVSVAADFVCSCIAHTPKDSDSRFGVCFEKALPELIRRMGE